MARFSIAVTVLALTCLSVGGPGNAAYADGVEPPQIVDGVLEAPPTVEAAQDWEQPTPEVLAAKTLAEANVSAVLADMLVDGALAAAPSEADAPIADPGEEGGTYPAAAKLAVVGAYQTKGWRCVPASGQTILQTMGISVTQDRLAQEMYTQASSGTFMGNAVRPLNDRQNRNDYVYMTNTANANQLLARTMSDVHGSGVALMIGVQMAAAPWYPAGEYSGRHAVAPYGYYTQSGGGLYLWDPYNETYFGGTTNYGGRKSVQLARAWTAHTQNSTKMVW